MARNQRYQLCLISPRYKYHHYAAQRELAHMLGKRRITLPGPLPLIAALTPAHYDIRIIDDEHEPLPTDPRPDIVGITTLSSTLDRVKEIAAVYRRLGVPVVAGGSFATFRPEEMLKVVDHVIIGEAEGAWQELLSDFERGEAKPIYQNAEPPAFKTSPFPRWDLSDIDNGLTVSVETSRGCPFACDFCVVNKMFGRKMRFRDVDDVIREIEAAPIKRVFFVADNFALNKEYARELVRRLKPLDVSWVCQTSIHVAEDFEFLREMAEAGCMSLLIGFESLNQAALHGVQKYHNHIEEFERAIRRVHSVGIHVLASFIVGFDEDTLETFDVIADFVARNDIVFPMMNAMSVAPGTAIHARMHEAGRTEVVEPAFRNGIFPSMHYNHISQRQMLDKFFAVLFDLFAWEKIRQRAMRLFGTGYFSEQSTEKVPLRDKITMSGLVLRRFLLSPDRDKRRLFLDLFGLVRQGKLAPDKAILFLLNMEAFGQYLDSARRFLPDVRARVDRIDKGPWAERSGGAGVMLSASPGCSASDEPAST